MDIQALLTGLLKDPAFQAIIQAIIKDLFAKISSGASPIAALQQGAAQGAAAATFHLTGNPVADIGALLANLQPHGETVLGGSPLSHIPPMGTTAGNVPGQFTS